MSLPLANRIALVTGGTHGIGKAVVQRLLHDGASVAVCARSGPDLDALVTDVGEARANVLTCRADVSNNDDVRRLVAETVARFGTIDVLVNNAGIYGPIGPAWENDPAHWIQTINVNLCGAFLVTQHVMPHMIKAGRGKVINMSGGGAATPFARYTAYAVSKAALVRFTETLAIEAAPHNIQVNAIAPGFVATRIHKDTLVAGERAGADFLRKTQEQLEQGAVDPSIPAALVAYLAQDQSNRITGRFISAVWDDWANFGSHMDEIANGDLYTLRRIVPKDRGLGWK
jgi:NAD(P)-dependent dehydrogenase (short-subunit alcohol dehydrogenase family)